MVEQKFVDIYPLTEERLLDYLPDIDCGDCGFSSCTAFAEALVESDAEPNRCPETDPLLVKVMESLLELEFPPMPYDVMMEKVDQGLFRIGRPQEDSPVLVTGNFVETIEILRGIMAACDVDAFLVAGDTKGYTIDNAVVEKRFTPFQILKALSDTEVGSLVSHRTLMIPGLARNLSAQISQFTNWQVIVGPLSGFEIPMFLLNEACQFV